MKFGTVCSGIEAPSVAWEPLGFKAQFFSEIDKFPSRVLAHHYPDVPNLGDMTKFKDWKNDISIDILCGGTPCQSFSVAGMRKGIDDPRGNLALVFMLILEKYRPRWVLWENVPGVLSNNGGRDFGSILGALASLGYGFAYRVLDAQFFGVAQERRRVFVVGHLGDWRPSAAVLFERHLMSRDLEKGRKQNDRNPARIDADFTQHDKGVGLYSEQNRLSSAPLIIDRAAFNQGQNASYKPVIAPRNYVPALVARGSHEIAIPIDFRNALRDPDKKDEQNRQGVGVRQNGEPSHTLTATFIPGVATRYHVRKFTPLECERLQGLPDNYTKIGNVKDAPRYTALGNSMAVPVMRWLGDRMQKVDNIIKEKSCLTQ